MKEADLYIPLPDGKVKCTACARYCQLGEGQVGLCGIRQNIGGKLNLLSYGKLFTGHIDPIEKKPVTHYRPGTRIFSVATSGCNWLCRYCFGSGTYVVTDQGMKKVEDLFDHGVVMEDSTEGRTVSVPSGVRAVTHMGLLKKIEAVFKHRYQGEMLSIVPYYLPRIKCTPNHKVLATRDPKTKPAMVRADELTKGYYLAIPKLRAEASLTESIDVMDTILSCEANQSARAPPSSPTPRNQRDLRVAIASEELSGLTVNEIDQKHNLPKSSEALLVRGLDLQGTRGFIEDYSIYSSPDSLELVKLNGGKHSGIPRYLRLDSDFAWLLGIYCAEGSTSSMRNRPGATILTFSFGSQKSNLLERTSRLLEKLFRERAKRVREGSVMRLRVGNSILAKTFKGMAGGDCYTKRVPVQVLFASNPSVVRAFVSGYLAGGGYYTKRPTSLDHGVIGASSISRELSLGVAYCFLRLESMPRVYTSVSSGNVSLMGRTVNRSSDLLIHLLARNCTFDDELINWQELPNMAKSTDDYLLIPLRKVEKSTYDGFVYNLQVEDDHTYTASFFAVSNCQNFDISQRRKVEGMDIEPAEVPRLAAAQSCQGIAYTYNEPTIFVEYARDIGIEARKRGLFNIFVSNGFATPDTVGTMDKFLDCITVDFKGSGEASFVRKYIGIPSADPILATLSEIKRRTKIHVEITDLIVPQVGDDLNQAAKLSRWIYDNLGPDTPIHFLRFHPDYKMMEFPITPVETLEAHHSVAKKAGLKYVYLGNVPGHPLENTFCAECGKVVIRRYGYEITGWYLDREKRCNFCGAKVPIEGDLASTVSEERFLPAYF